MTQETAPQIKPRSYQPMSAIIRSDIAKLLEQHPETFECIIYPVKTRSNEAISVNKDDDVVTSLEGSERKQEYDNFIIAKALIIHDTSTEFGMMDSGESESLFGGNQPINIKLSVDGIRKYSIIQWKECNSTSPSEIETKSVYVHELKSVGHSLAVGAICVCHPLYALGEIPSLDDEDNEVENEENNNENQENIQEIDKDLDNKHAGVL